MGNCLKCNESKKNLTQTQNKELQQKLNECANEIQNNMTEIRNGIQKIEKMESSHIWSSYVSKKEEQIQKVEVLIQQWIQNKKNIESKLKEIDENIKQIYKNTLPNDIKEFKESLIDDYKKLTSIINDVDNQIKFQKESSKHFNNDKQLQLLDEFQQILNFQIQFDQIEQSWSQAQKDVLQPLLDELEEITKLAQQSDR